MVLLPDLTCARVHGFFCRRFASKLSVHVFESQGLLQACSSTADGRQVPAAAVYVKVFARDSSGDAWFYK
jgi:hypothetical protein